MSSPNVLKHKTRKVIYNYISTHPGVSFRTIMGIFDLTKGTLRYHLDYLERYSIIYSRKKGNYKCYYSVETEVSDLHSFCEYDPNTLTALQRRIITIIRQKPGITISELESNTGLDKGLLRHNLKVLRDQMIIWKLGNGRNTRYEYATAEKIQNEFMKFVTMEYLEGEIDEKTYLLLKGEIERERLKRKSFKNDMEYPNENDEDKK